MILNHCKLHSAFTGDISGDDCCVEIESGKIKSVSLCSSDEPGNEGALEHGGAKATNVYDCKGRTLLPGLIDLHTHITFLGGVGVMQAHDPKQLLVEAADQANRYLEHGFTTIRDCVREGVHTIEHATYLSEETTDLLLETEDCYLVPTLAAMYVSQTDPAERAFWLARLTPMLESCAKTIGYAYRQGALLGFGTDSAPMSPQYEDGVEFRFRKEYCGMENLDILLQATVNSARIAGLDDIGEIKPGMKADLILVDGDPVSDLSVMYKKPLQVWKDGTLRK